MNLTRENLHPLLYCAKKYMIASLEEKIREAIDEHKFIDSETVFNLLEEVCDSSIAFTM